MGMKYESLTPDSDFRNRRKTWCKFTVYVKPVQQINPVKPVLSDLARHFLVSDDTANSSDKTYQE